MSITRRQIRERVLQVLYAHELSKDPIEKIKVDLLSDIADKDSKYFADKLIHHVVENRIHFDTLIKTTVDNWDIERIALIDFIIIKMCLCEFFYFEEIPPKVSINEAIDLAKDYSTKNSGKFVNGILDSLLMKLKDSNEIQKTGKGLISHSTKSDNEE
ncbi:MAG: transcription antitermination factor NusB [Ignavibacteriae bacterium]|nr:MAG: transcription antitermination factor NusB [Ignavibacteriota bacterium]